MDTTRHRGSSANSRISASGSFARSSFRRLEEISQQERLRELDVSEELPDFDLLYSTDESLHQVTEYLHHASFTDAKSERPTHHTHKNHRISGYLDDINRLDLISSSTQFPKTPFKCSLIGSDFGFREFTRISDLDSVLKEKILAKSVSSWKELSPFWIDFQNPSAYDMSIVELIFNLHPLTSHECTFPEAREKWECMNDYLFLVFHEISPEYSNSWINVVPIRMALFSSCILTFHSVPLPTVAEAINMVDKSGNIFTPDRCLYTILRNSIVSFEKKVGVVVFEVQSLDEIILALSSSSSDSDDLLARIRNVNGQLSSLYWMMCIKQEIFLSLCTMRNRMLNRSTQMYCRALLDCLVRLRLGLEISRQTLETSHSNYLATASIQNAQISNKTNDLMKKLSSISTIILPLSLVAGLFGMNVHVPGEGVENLYWFWGICSCMAIVVVILAVFFRNRGLL
eukprot:TRINITY_DN5487_c0_g1_i3.p1 TRINITY_DN5487_c0_g1~~TRINITY_DN5487_c0_g1_i3.p1  ORF type:complete len:457 (+),score=79.53 TRINITY_DN5487_c0_g1_i3:66-1436(+)